MYTLIGAIKSRAFRVRWMLEELELEYSFIPAPPHSNEVKTLNPSGKIPVLLVDEVPLTDSTAIMTYLADAHGTLTSPAGSIERAQQDGLTQMILDEMDACLWTAARHSFVLPEQHRVPEIKPSLQWEFARSEDKLGAILDDSPFLMGDEITVPDLLLTHCLGWAIIAKFGISNPRLSEYLSAMRERPGYKRASGD